METNENLLTTELHIDSTGHSYLYETAKWATFLAIIGFIGSGILVLVAIYMGTKLSELSEFNSLYRSSSMIGGTTIVIIYLVIAVIYFFLSLFLYRFASKMKIALNTTDQDSLNNSLGNLKTLYKTMGILTIVYLALLLLLFIFGIGSALMR